MAQNQGHFKFHDKRLCSEGLGGGNVLSPTVRGIGVLTALLAAFKDFGVVDAFALFEDPAGGRLA